MCTVIPCGCGQTTVGGSILQIAGLVAIAGGAVFAAAGPTIVVVTAAATVVVAAVAFGPTRKGAWWVTRNMLAPAAALTVTAVALWLAGRSFTPRSRRRRETSGATWLRAGCRVAEDSRTDVHWYAWPGWQRTIARVALLGVVTAAYLVPVITALVALLIAVTITARIAVLLWARRRDNAPVLRVKALVGYPLHRRIGRATPRALPADVVDVEVVDFGTARHAVRG